MPILSWLLDSPLPVGSEAPDFSLSDENGKKVQLSDFRRQSNVVLVFYPGDNTSICTRQLCEFRDSWDQVRSKGAVLLGVNPQSADSHRRFIQKQRYPFPLLVDKGREVAKLYHAGGLIVRRTVYLIDRDGVIRFAERGKPAPEKVLAAIPET
jgi:peroxiredoxin Q/BCP